MALADKSATELKSMLDKGDTSSREIMESVLDRIDEKEPQIGAFLTLRERNELISEAESIDTKRSNGESVGVLAGLPVAIKDSICTKDIRTSCASKYLEDFIPPYNATAIERIYAEDGIIIGKTNLDEFCMGSSTENSAYKITRNPHKLDCVPGGTSGGSAAAVAAGQCILALGSDTGGSIRQPASFCGVVGMKPSYGRISRYGLVAYASSLDQIGPIARSVEDTALLLSVISGKDPHDATSFDLPVEPYSENLDAKQVFRIGVPEDYFGEGLDAEVKESIEKSIDLLREQGHEIVPISLPHTKYAVPTYYIIACAEASANLARYDGVRYGLRSADAKTMKDMYVKSRTEGLGHEVKQRIMLGTYVLSSGYYDAYYLKAQKVRRLISNDFINAFETCDVIVGPVAPTAAYKIGEKTDDPLAMYLGDIYSVMANLTGMPAISLPCGKTEDGRPIGIQFTGPATKEQRVLNLAASLEKLL